MELKCRGSFRRGPLAGVRTNGWIGDVLRGGMTGWEPFGHRAESCWRFGWPSEPGGQRPWSYACQAR